MRNGDRFWSGDRKECGGGQLCSLINERSYENGSEDVMGS